jgi:hypothetical protein
MKAKRSALWFISKNDMQILVEKSSTFSDILRNLGLSHKGGNCKTLKNVLNFHNISFDHIKQGRNSTSGKNFSLPKVSLDDILIENSSYARVHLKARLIKEGLLENKCYLCNSDPTWYDKPLVMVLDHINGISDDNRKENLRLLCPNCNSQQQTFAGRNKISRSSNGRT